MFEIDTSIEQVREFVRRPLAFSCKPAGRRDSTERFVAHVVHFMNSPGSPNDLTIASSLFGAAAAPFEGFYGKHNGLTLYRDTLSSSAGVEIPLLGALPKINERFRGRLSENESEDDPDSFVVFATAPRSANYFVVQMQGPNIGQILYTDHETNGMAVFADDLRGFLLRIIREPVKLLAKDLGCFARYSDGSTRTQWIPESIA